MRLEKTSFALVETASSLTEPPPQTALKVRRNTRVALHMIQAVDETLEMLGRKSKPQVYTYLEKRFGLRKDEIPDRPEAFSKGLFSLFGSASRPLELKIVKKLYNRLGMEFKPESDFNFADTIAGLEIIG